MTNRLYVFAALIFVSSSALAVLAANAGATVTPAFRQPIANVPGKSLTAVVVDYAPGAGSPPHRHAHSAFIYAYVLSGSIRSQVDDNPAKIYRAGESWSEPPGAHHKVSENASTSEPARLLAIFVANSEDQSLTTPDAN